MVIIFSQHCFMKEMSLQIGWQEIALARDILFSSLINQLILNKILLHNYFATKSSKSGSTNSRSQKEESPIQQPEQIVDSISKHQQIFEEEKNSHNLIAKNDTKNIPKNYGKAILSFIQKYPRTKELAKAMGVNHSDLLMHAKRFRNKVSSIEGLKRMWGAGNSSHKFRKCMRILSYLFMRKHCLPYIFHSKVRNYSAHIKYSKKLKEGIENPNCFTHIKDY